LELKPWVLRPKQWRLTLRIRVWIPALLFLTAGIGLALYIEYVRKIGMEQLETHKLWTCNKRDAQPGAQSPD
jgi:hypothetical protein